MSNDTSQTMDHAQLITEMPQVERLTTAERLRLARKRRGQQLKRWAQREREYNLKRKTSQINGDGGPSHNGHSDRNIHFVPAIMLLEAAARNDVDEVRRLLELGVSPDSTNEDGLTALHQCCIDDSEEMMKVLVDFDADVNSADSEQWTPLHAAATCGHLHLVKFLIEKGANLLAVNGDGNMPYDICEDETTLSFIENEMAKKGVTQELIDATRAQTEQVMLEDLKQLAADGGDLEYRDQHGATPLHIAAANGYLQVLEFLLDNHVSTEVVDNDQWQPLHAGACWGHLEAVEILAQNGADISAVTRSGETPFDITEDPDIRERLVELAEQRLRLAEPRNRRARSSSTRTQSIRRSSLRDKINTTKKDVAQEKLIYSKTVTAASSDEMLGPDDLPPSTTDVLDVNDVEITLSPTNSNKPSNDPSLPQQRPVQLVAPTQHKKPPPPARTVLPKIPDRQPPPTRPARASQAERQAAPPPSDQDILTSNLQQSLPAIYNTASPENPINIHVSVTINPALVPGAAQSFPSSPGTLADLKRVRSQNRVSGGSNTSSTVSLSSHPSNVALDGVTLNPMTVEQMETKQGEQVELELKKFAAVEVVGPPKKSGCCVVM